VLVRKGELRAAQADVAGAKWERFPGVALEASSYISGATASADSKSLVVQQPIWDGGRISSNIDRAQTQLAVAQAAVEQAQQQVLRDTVINYFEVLRFEARLVEAKANETEHARLYDVIERRFQSGVSPKTDLTQAASRLQQAIADRIQIDRQLESAKALLEQMVGRQLGTLITPPDADVSIDKPSELQQQAKDFSAEMRKLKLEIQLAEFEIQLAKAKLMPQVVVGYRQLLGSVANGTDRGSSYVTLKLQTTGGFSAFSAIDAAVARKEAAIDSVASLQRILVQQVRAAIGDVQAYSLQRKPISQLVNDYDDIVASYLRQFQVGRRSWIEVLNAQREKSQAVYSSTDLDAALNAGTLRLLLLTGQLDIANVSTNL
jgi:adhesin transport system outer membrane protein